MNIEALKEAHDLSLDGRDFAARQIILDVIANLEKEALSEPEQKYHRGDRLICLETEEYCIIHISGTDRQWVKFPDSHIGVYTNEQVAELFELLPKEPEPVAWEQFYPDIGKPKFVAQPTQEPAFWLNEQGQLFATKGDVERHSIGQKIIPLYTTPPQRTWVGLTHDEVNQFAAGCHLGKSVQGAIYEAEARLKDKNTRI